MAVDTQPSVIVAGLLAPADVRTNTEYVWGPGVVSRAMQMLLVLEQPFHV